MNSSDVVSTGHGDSRPAAHPFGASVNPLADTVDGVGVNVAELADMPLGPAADADAAELADVPLGPAADAESGAAPPNSL